MKNCLETHLREATARAFETLAFMFPTLEVEEPQRTARLDCAARVDFEGAFSGHLVLAVFGDTPGEVLRNMLGAEDPVGGMRETDALEEMANVICGNVLSDVAGADSSFRLTKPRRAGPADVASLSARAADSPAEERATVVMGLEMGRVEALIHLTAAAAAGSEG